ncbi:KTSC domain-containing protein [Isosphaeraceae bacterium EP7]
MRNGQPVESSLINAVRYDAASSFLDVELRPEMRRYRFFDVPYSTYAELMEAPSKGSYFNDFIREQYPMKPLRSRRAKLP